MFNHTKTAWKVMFGGGLAIGAMISHLEALAQNVPTLPPSQVDPGAVLQYNMLTAPMTPAYPYFYSYPWPGFEYPVTRITPGLGEMEERPSVYVQDGVIPQAPPRNGLYQTPDGRLFILPEP